MRQFSLQKFQLGYTLIDLLMGLAMASTAVVAMASVIFHIQNSAESVHVSATRSELNFMIRRILLNRNSLKQTILRNPPMKVAVTVAPADYALVGGTLYTDNRAYPVDLFDAQGNQIVGKGSDDTGSAATPVFYTINGAICTTPGIGTCLISATAVARIQGLSKWNSPDNMFPITFYPASHPSHKPDFMTVNYLIKFIPKQDGTLLNKKSFSGTVFLAIEDIGDLVP